MEHAITELAYIGDAVFELLVREMLLSEGISFRNMNPRAQEYVSAVAQSQMYHKIFTLVTEEEQYILKRGRNYYCSSSRAKNAKASEYRHATGLEALFGYLHQQGNHTRIREIFALCTGDIKNE